jgi:hypothetical protein
MQLHGALTALTLLLAATVMLPHAVQAYEFDMVNQSPPPLLATAAALPLRCGQETHALSSSKLIRHTRSSAPVVLRVPAAASFNAAAAALLLLMTCLLLLLQVFQTKCIMEDVGEHEEVQGNYYAYQREGAGQAVPIDARVGC